MKIHKCSGTPEITNHNYSYSGAAVRKSSGIFAYRANRVGDGGEYNGRVISDGTGLVLYLNDGRDNISLMNGDWSNYEFRKTDEKLCLEIK